MKSINLYYHGGSANHGCEAIVRSTRKLLNMDVNLWTMDIDSDRLYGLDKVVMLYEDEIYLPRKPSIKWFVAAAHHKLTNTDYIYTKYAHNKFFSHINKGDVCLSIGGDNYCYAGREKLAYYNKILHSKGAKTVLWGCSVEPKLLEQNEIVKDIQQYDLIVARESISYNALKRINNHTILAPDPAFFLDTVSTPFVEGSLSHNTVGINISPLIIANENRNGIVFESFRKLIDYILTDTNMSVALIPHVVEPGNDDRVTLQTLQNAFPVSERIIIINDNEARKLKGVISNCRFFVGARTHATIAAYSYCIPTLVVGYSVKANGIARDLFGNEDHYVIPVQSIVDSQSLTQSFQWIMEQEARIRGHLQTYLPIYKSSMEKAITAVRGMIEL